MNRLLLLAAMLAWPTLASAQAPAAVSEQDFLADMPIVLSVSRLPQRLDETPGAVTILDRDFIRLSGARDVADLLRLVPGFQTSTSFESDGPQASYHGAFGGYSNRIQVLIDGRSVYSPFLVGSVAPGLQTVALADIERIEVLRGSNSAAYGARAMLGVINIVTRHTVDTLGLQATVGVGENRVRDSQARIGWGNEEASFRITVDRRADDGLAGSNGHNQVSRVNIRSDLRTRAGDEVQLRAGALAIDSGKGFPGRVDDPVRDRFFGSSYAQFDWRRSLGEDEDLAFGMSHTEESYRDTFPYSLLPLGINGNIDIDFSGRASNDNLSLQHTFRRGSALRVVWGGELRREQVKSAPLYNTNTVFVTDFARLFANAEWRLAQDLILNAGAMAENSSVSGSSLAPRLMFNWHVAAGQTLRAGLSRAHRPPSTFEKFSDVRYTWNGHLLRVTTVASGAVQPETVLARELGYFGDFSRFGLNLDVRVFDERISGFVRRMRDDAVPGPYDYVNDEDISIRGMEYQLKFRPWRNAQIIFNQARMNISSYDLGTASSAPELATSLVFIQKLPWGVDLSLMHQNSGLMTLQGATDDQQRATRRTDLRVGVPMRLGGNRAELALVVQNLGSPTPDYRPSFEFQRRAFVTLRVEN